MMPNRTLHRGAILAIVLASYTMIVLDISIVITALPKIHRSLHFSETSLSWVQNAYLLAFGGLLLLAARASDLLGRRRVFLAGLVLFTVASVGVGTAQSEIWLIAARAVQGAGAAILAPTTLALLQATFPEGQERTRAVAYYAAVAGVAATVGLVVGGMFAGWLSWRDGFFINAPIGVAMVLATLRFVPETAPLRGQADLAGALLSTLGMTALVFGIVHAGEAGWTDSTALGSLVAGVVLLVGFVQVERHAAQPIMPLRLFANRERAGGYAARFLFLGAMVPFWFFTTQYLQNVLGYSPVTAGLAFLPVTIVNFAVAMAVPRLTRRFGNPTLLVGALIVATIGMAWLGRVTAGSSYWTGVALPMVLLGAGQGGALGPLTAAGLAGVAAEDAGAAGGVTQVAHQIGGSFGLGVLVAVFAAAGGSGLAHRISVALTVGAAMLLLAVLVSVAVRPRRSKTVVEADGFGGGRAASAVAERSGSPAVHNLTSTGRST